VPNIHDPAYLNTIYSIVEKEQICAALSLIDPELSILANHSDEFRDRGVLIIGSGFEQCERSLDKWKMYEWMVSNGFLCAKTFINKDKLFAGYIKSSDLQNFTKAVIDKDKKYIGYIKSIDLRYLTQAIVSGEHSFILYIQSNDLLNFGKALIYNDDSYAWHIQLDDFHL
jgi:hypothetical protein